MGLWISEPLACVNIMAGWCFHCVHSQRGMKLADAINPLEPLPHNSEHDVVLVGCLAARSRGVRIDLLTHRTRGHEAYAFNIVAVEILHSVPSTPSLPALSKSRPSIAQ